nr:hypothetical protein [Tanacetum cinerariifolium]
YAPPLCASYRTRYDRLGLKNLPSALLAQRHSHARHQPARGHLGAEQIRVLGIKQILHLAREPQPLGQQRHIEATVENGVARRELAADVGGGLRIALLIQPADRERTAPVRQTHGTRDQMARHV